MRQQRQIDAGPVCAWPTAASLFRSFFQFVNDVGGIYRLDGGIMQVVKLIKALLAARSAGDVIVLQNE